MAVGAVAISLEVLGDTTPLWNAWLDDAARRFHTIAELDVGALSADLTAAAVELDRWAELGVGDWRAALRRFAEERAPVYLRPDAGVSSALRRLAGSGTRVGVFADAPEPLAALALEHLGAARRVDALECGAGALDRLRDRLGHGTVVVTSRRQLSDVAR